MNSSQEYNRYRRINNARAAAGNVTFASIQQWREAGKPDNPHAPRTRAEGTRTPGAVTEVVGPNTPTAVRPYAPGETLPPTPGNPQANIVGQRIIATRILTEAEVEGMGYPRGSSVMVLCLEDGTQIFPQFTLRDAAGGMPTGRSVPAQLVCFKDGIEQEITLTRGEVQLAR